MSDNNDFLRTDVDDFRLRADVLALMLKGAGYAAALSLVIGLSMWALYAVSTLLPEDSKEADDPTPFSYNLIQGENDTV